MFNRIKTWFSKDKFELDAFEKTLTSEELAKIKYDAEEFESRFLFGQPSPGRWPGNFPRSYYDRNVACDVRDCVRPSAFTVLSYANVDVDVPGNTPSRLNTSKQILDIYKQYHVCDRCFRSDKDGVRSKATYIEGPQMEYDPEKDEKTQKKLTNIKKSASEK